MRTKPTSYRYELILLRLPSPDSPGFVIDTRRAPIPISQKLTVGRSPTNDLQLHSQSISREHASLEPTEEGLLVTDLGSYNGTFHARTCTKKEIGNPVPIKEGTHVQPDGVLVFPGPIAFKVTTVPGGTGDDSLISDPIHKFELLLLGIKDVRSIKIDNSSKLILNRRTIEGLIGLDDPYIGNRHCSISIQNGRLTIEANPGDIKVNGGDKTNAILEVNDVIQIGTLCFRFRSTG